MKSFKADLHLHTVLSPCGSLEMSPRHIVDKAVEKGLDMIAVTDHNTTRQFPVVQNAAAEHGLRVLGGVEVNTREEVHCLAYFETLRQLEVFDSLLYDRLADIPNEPDRFGHQVLVDEQELIVDQPRKLLISAVDMSIGEVEQEVHQMGGLFVPAHIDRMHNGIIAQLGFIPGDLNCDAMEISIHSNIPQMIDQYPYLNQHAIIRGSDAHHPEDIGHGMTRLEVEELSFEEIRKAFNGLQQRKAHALV